MKLFPRSKTAVALRDVIIPTRLLTLRLTKLFENTCALLRLRDDGEEKSAGEYILDVHYVSSLVEKILERLRMIVQDASVLAPASSEALYARLASITRSGSERFVDNAGERVAEIRKAGAAAGAAVEAEYVLLRQAMQWMADGEPDRERSVMDLLHRILDIVYQKRLLASLPAQEPPFVTIDTDGARIVVNVIGLDRPGPAGPSAERAVALENLDSRPFSLLVLGAGESSRTGNAATRPIRRWIAIVGPDGVHLAPAEPGGDALLVARQTGDPDADFIFALCGRNFGAGGLGRSGFRVERTGFGSAAYIYDVSVEALGEQLARTGEFLFGPTRRG